MKGRSTRLRFYVAPGRFKDEDGQTAFRPSGPRAAD